MGRPLRRFTRDILGARVKRLGSAGSPSRSSRLDATDWRQLSGCLEDARIDRLQGDVLAMR